jgi:hypothetical protein
MIMCACCVYIQVADMSEAGTAGSISSIIAEGIAATAPLDRQATAESK